KFYLGGAGKEIPDPTMRKYPDPPADRLLPSRTPCAPSDEAVKLMDVLDVFHRLLGVDAAAGTEAPPARPRGTLVAVHPAPLHRRPRRNPLHAGLPEQLPARGRPLVHSGPGKALARRLWLLVQAGRPRRIRAKRILPGRGRAPGTGTGLRSGRRRALPHQPG